MLLSVQLCPELGQHLLILITSLQILVHVLLRCLLQMLFHCFVLLACRGMQLLSSVTYGNMHVFKKPCEQSYSAARAVRCMPQY